MDIVSSIRETIVNFIVLYKLELLTIAGIIIVIYYIVTQQNKLSGVFNNEL
jgi:cytosine/uracil/thiamine/allantoin permease